MSRKKFDVVIVGAGVAGSAAAIELNSLGWKVGLLHGGSDGADAVESLSPAAARYIGTIGLKAGLPILGVVAWWGSDEEQHRSYTTARVVPRMVLAAQLRNRATECGTELLVLHSRLVINSNQDGMWGLSTSNSQLCSRYLIDATGCRSVIGRHLGARRQSADNLFSLSFSVHADNIGTWTESTPDGWWNVCCDAEQGTASFYSIPEIIRRARTCIGDYWSRTRHLRSLFERGTFPNVSLRDCGSSRLSPCGGPGWLAVGDAAWTVQPLAAGGVAKALQDAARLPRFLNDPKKYISDQTAQFNSYVESLHHQYSLETRWKSELFWSQKPSKRGLAQEEQSVSSLALNASGPRSLRLAPD